MTNRIRRLLPHASILICNMYIVFYLIDRVNSAMNFIDNGLTKGLLAILCAISIYNALRLWLSGAAAPRYGAPPRRTDTRAATPRRAPADRRRADAGRACVRRPGTRPEGRG